MMAALSMLEEQEQHATIAKRLLFLSLTHVLLQQCLPGMQKTLFLTLLIFGIRRTVN